LGARRARDAHQQKNERDGRWGIQDSFHVPIPLRFR
jgi:hypothetical protein